jgi:hypothetical protein
MTIYPASPEGFQKFWFRTVIRHYAHPQFCPPHAAPAFVTIALMTPRKFFAMALDPAQILRARGIEPDPWQRDILLSQERYLLLNCCRQAGKSTVSSALALHQALFHANATILLLSPGLRQSMELFHKVLANYRGIGRPVAAASESQRTLALVNGSRIVCLPGKEETIRGYSPDLLVIDEAARVPDDLYKSVRPMLAVSRGRLVALSTPFGQRGWFFDEWQGQGPWKKIQVPWNKCGRISPEFIAEERRALGEGWVNQEYCCLFTALEGLVYPDFELAYVTDSTAPAIGQAVGGIDWGWRNPFAAVWGVLDRDDVLWIEQERYLRETPLHEHVRALPKGVMWYADPAGRTELEEFRAAGHTIRKGVNDIRLGITAVTARLRTGRLKINTRRCPNLVAEAKLYRYPTASERAQAGENPVDEDNHALGALRYLISRLDGRFLGKLRGKARPDSEAVVEGEKPPPSSPQLTLSCYDDAAWTYLT